MVRPGTIAPVVKMVKAGGEREGRVVGVAKAVGKREGQKLVVVQKGGRFAALAGKVEGKEEEEEE